MKMSIYLLCCFSLLRQAAVWTDSKLTLRHHTRIPQAIFQYGPPKEKVLTRYSEHKLFRDCRPLISTLGENGVLLCPSAPQPAPYHYSCFLRPFNFAYWAIFNALRLPATQVPLGLNADGLPLGVQVVAAPHNDALCLTVAEFLEKEFGGYKPPCKVFQ